MSNVIKYDKFLNEEFSIKKNKELIIDTAKDLNVNIMFVLTFGTSIAAYIPIAEHIINNQNFNVPITKETLIFCIISAFGIVFKDIQAKELKQYIKENNLSDIFNYFVKSITSFKNIYEYLMKFKSIEFLTDMFSYTAILCPFILAISDIINNKVMTIEELIGCGMSIGLGVISAVIKNSIKSIWKKFTKKIETSEKILKNNNEMMNNILEYEDFVLNERKRQPRKSNLKDVEQISGGVKYKNEIFPSINYPKRYIGKGKHKYRVLAREGDKVKPINFGDRIIKSMPKNKLTKKYWESLPNWM